MEADGRRPADSVDDFLGEPTRSLAAWRWLWEGDHRFPIRSHRRFWGRLLVAFKRLMRPLVKPPQNDLWERQRVFNLILLEHLERLDRRDLEQRIGQLEGALPERLDDVLRHNDALFALLDQKIDRYRRRAGELENRLGAALAVAEVAATAPAGEEALTDPAAASGTAALVAARDEEAYLALEERFRGTEDEIGERLTPYLSYLEGGRGEVLDLGCGRGEALALLAEHGIAARGVDASATMVEACRRRGLTAERKDLVDALAEAPPESLGGVVSFHVVEHLPAAVVDRLVRLAYRALAPGGVLVLETPNPLSLVVAARNFWLDPTHLRPLHPESLALALRLAGFDPVERLDLRPFAAAERLPETARDGLDETGLRLAAEVDRLRDHLDDLLYGSQDYALVGRKPGG